MVVFVFSTIFNQNYGLSLKSFHFAKPGCSTTMYAINILHVSIQKKECALKGWVNQHSDDVEHTHLRQFD